MQTYLSSHIVWDLYVDDHVVFVGVELRISDAGKVGLFSRHQENSPAKEMAPLMHLQANYCFTFELLFVYYNDRHFISSLEISLPDISLPKWLSTYWTLALSRL